MITQKESTLWTMSVFRRLDPLHKEHEIAYNIIYLFNTLFLTIAKKKKKKISSCKHYSVQKHFRYTTCLQTAVVSDWVCK